MITGVLSCLETDVECYVRYIPSRWRTGLCTLGDITYHTASIPAVDIGLYSLSSEEAAFFKAQIGIDDDEDLTRHILEVQAKIYKPASYPWIRGFIFILVNISSNPVYEHILKLGRERPDAVLLDIGYCFGIDARKAPADGFPAKNIIASDIHNDMLELSHDLFKTTPASYPACQFPGDVLDPKFISIAAPSDDVSPAPATITGRALASLLSSQPGSVICGHQVGKAEKGISIVHVMGCEHHTLAHSPKSWKSMWDGEVFEKGGIKVEAELVDFPLHRKTLTTMRWSVMMERCIRDCVPACREQGKVVKSTTLRQSPKDNEWLTKLRCYPAATTNR
ncbi:hypothetical protein BDR03DRAFT_917757 [Suillus americanus]|nr:hypothetical protein BDR03DRAFT_917757 [Suillus americanus]